MIQKRPQNETTSFKKRTPKTHQKNKRKIIEKSPENEAKFGPQDVQKGAKKVPKIGPP